MASGNEIIRHALCIRACVSPRISICSRLSCYEITAGCIRLAGLGLLYAMASMTPPRPIDWEQYTPDWADGGRTVEVLTKDGQIKRGLLEATDVIIAEDDIPLWTVAIDGVEISLYDFEEFRYV